MPALSSKLNPRSSEFKASAQSMDELVADLHAQLDRVALGGGEASRTRHAACSNSGSTRSRHGTRVRSRLARGWCCTAPQACAPHLPPRLCRTWASPASATSAAASRPGKRPAPQ